MAHIICGATPSCGFRVHDRNYEEKTQFTTSICARCNGPIKIVKENTTEVIEGATMSLTGEINES